MLLRWKTYLIWTIHHLALKGDMAKMEYSTERRHCRKGLLQNDELYKYLLDTSVYPRESELLKEIRDATADHPLAYVGTAPDAGQLMAMLMKTVNAKKTIEIGVFTGYSLLLTALSLPDDGKIMAIDINRKTYEIGLPIIRKAGVEHKIEFIESEALPILDKLLEHKNNEGCFDFAFVDADKNNYLSYHKRLMKLVKVGGFIVYDNTLWGGTVALSDPSLAPEEKRPYLKFIVEFNKTLAVDPCIEISQVPVGDGMTICKRIE